MRPPLCLVPVLGRGSLASAVLHAGPLYATSVAVARQVGRVVVVQDAVQKHVDAVPLDGATWLCLPDQDRLFRRLLREHDVVVVLDPLCPLVSVDVVRRVMAAARPSAMAVRPVVDTLKATDGPRIVATVDRNHLAVVTSPVVVPATVLAGAADLAKLLSDPVSLAGWLREQSTVTQVPVPSATRRVEDSSALELLRAIDAVGHRLHER